MPPARPLIGLGGNLGDRRATLDGALEALANAPGTAVLKASAFHETEPVGGPPGQGAFLNAAAELETTLGPFELLELLRQIEARFGRTRSARWGPRTLDLDLILFEGRIISTPELVVPHPRFAARRFVLAPLAEIAPEAVDPITGRTVTQLLEALDHAPSA